MSLHVKLNLLNFPGQNFTQLELSKFQGGLFPRNVWIYVISGFFSVQFIALHCDRICIYIEVEIAQV